MPLIVAATGPFAHFGALHGAGVPRNGQIAWGYGGGALALVAGNLSCIGIVLVFPFSASVAELWRGATEYPTHVYLLPAMGFGLALAVCLALAVTSLALRAERPGSAVPAMLALTLIGIQLLVFLGFAAVSTLFDGAG